MNGCVYRAPDLSYESSSVILPSIKIARNREENREYKSKVVFGDINHPENNWTQEGIGHSNVGNDKLFFDSINDSFLTKSVILQLTRGLKTTRRSKIIKLRYHNFGNKANNS